MCGTRNCAPLRYLEDPHGERICLERFVLYERIQLIGGLCGKADFVRIACNLSYDSRQAFLRFWDIGWKSAEGSYGLSIGGPHDNSSMWEMHLRSMANPRWVYRAWYYFRQGYSTYLTFILGYASTLVTVYYLAIRNMPPLLDVFPHFAEFAILATVIGGPLAVAIGWVHMKRSRLFSSEQDISVESNPYNYKLPPGYWGEAFMPAMLAQLRMLRHMSERGGFLSDSERVQLEDLESKMETLIRGGYIGSPRRRLNF